MNLSVKQAGGKLLETYRHLLLEVHMDLFGRGIPLWELSDLTEQALLKNGYTPYLFFADGQPCGTILLGDHDYEYWGDDFGNVLYIHKLAVHPDYQGHQLSHRFLDFARDEALKRGRDYLRLDCRDDRPRLRHVYESYGFHKVGVMHIEPRQSALYELKI